MIRSILASASVLGAASLACAVTSCAANDDGPGETALPGQDAGAGFDPNADAGPCADGGDRGCAERELTCDEADFCTVETVVDSRYALLDVWGSSASDVWAVGSGGTLIHWDGAAWTKIQLPWKDTLRGISGSSASDVWIASSMNVILHGGIVDGAPSFTLAPPIDPTDTTNFTGATLTHAWVASDGAVFVGGPATFWQPRHSLWRYQPGVDPPSWEPVSTYCEGIVCPDVHGIWGTTSSDIWIAGGGVHRSNGPVGGGGGAAAEWTTNEAILTGKPLRDIWGTSDSDVWIIGDEGTIRHWSNPGSKLWELVDSPTTENLRAIWGSGPNDAWIVGDGGTILHFDGTKWSPRTTTLPAGPKPRLYGVWGSGPNDVWAVGEGVVLHFTGAKAPVSKGER